MSWGDRMPGEWEEDESDEEDLEIDRLLEDVAGVVFWDDERLCPFEFWNDRAVCQSGKLRFRFWWLAHSFLYLDG